MTNKLQLPTVSLICVDCLNVNLAIKVIEHCKTLCDFGDVKLLTSIPCEYEHAVRIKPLNSLVAYSIFMLKKLHEYIEKDMVMIVQRDGWILNTSAWDDSWYKLDYIGGLFMQVDWVGSGGFSLRSKKIMEAVSKTLPDWDGTQKNADEIQKTIPFYEDGMLSLTPFAKGFKIASLEQAANFSQAGNRNPKYFRERAFGWHRTWQTIDFKTGIVDSSDTTKDIHVSYDAEINELQQNEV
jgi:hypothetical protein